MAPVIQIDSRTLDRDSLAILASLEKLPWFADFYLAGSAALTLYIQHRPVRDLDFMSPVQRLRSIERRDHLQDLLQVDAGFRVETARDGFFYLRSSESVGLRFYYYPYPLIDPEEQLEATLVASPVDLGLMKLGAIISRGTQRDFVDLFVLARLVPLAELLGRSHEKFGHVRDFPLQALKGLADRSQIVAEPLPDLTEPVVWEDIARWLDEQVSTLGRQRVGLE